MEKQKLNQLRNAVSKLHDLKIKQITINDKSCCLRNTYIMDNYKCSMLSLPKISNLTETNSTKFILIQAKDFVNFENQNSRLKDLGFISTDFRDIICLSQYLLRNRTIMSQSDFYLVATKPSSNVREENKILFINHDYRLLDANEICKPLISKDNTSKLGWERQWLIYKC